MIKEELIQQVENLLVGVNGSPMSFSDKKELGYRILDIQNRIDLAEWGSGKMTRFKKGELTQEAFDVIIHDLNGLKSRDQDDFNYHLELLRGNLEDIFGINEVSEE